MKKKAKEDFENYLKYTPNAKDQNNIKQAIQELDAECGN
ncbi:MAG: Tetratricopeptide repeat protein [Candidatus Nitrosotenuis sp.]|nr:Tetratricopeptide repeat protein [Candidatus Nitrosotenuis sp.]